MAERLKVDIDDLDRLTVEVRGALAAVSREDYYSSETVNSVGHPLLADKVRSFENSWDDRRREIIDRVTALNGQLLQVVETFSALENDLKHALDAPPAPPAVRDLPDGSRRFV